jgi:hypothetical protein
MSNHVLNFYREAGGQRTHWRMTLDASMTVLEEVKVEDKKDSRVEKIKADLTARGIGYTEKEGQIVITAIPDAERKVIEALTDAKRCWFPGCSEIVAAYNEERKNLSADCPQCQVGALMRKYRSLLLAAEKTSA